LDVKIELIHRNCLLTRFAVDAYRGKNDEAILECPIDLSGRELPLEMLICRKKRYLKMIEEHDYLKKILGHSNPKHFKQSD
jgi:hypothetical protein